MHVCMCIVSTTVLPYFLVFVLRQQLTVKTHWMKIFYSLKKEVIDVGNSQQKGEKQNNKKMFQFTYARVCV